MTRRFFASCKRKLRRRGRVAFLRSRVALMQWGSADNPFLGRAWQVETRAGQPWRTALIFVALVLLLNSWWLWPRVGAFLEIESNGSAGQLPVWLGGNWIGYAALSAALVGAWSALLAPRIRIAPLLRHEQLLGTLDQLRLLPISAERWLWLMSAPGVFLAVLCWFLGLPLFVLAVFVGQWSFFDVINLGIVFVWLGHCAPAPLPGTTLTLYIPPPPKQVISLLPSSFVAAPNAAATNSAPISSTRSVAAQGKSAVQVTSAVANKTLSSARNGTVASTVFGVGALVALLWGVLAWAVDSGLLGQLGVPENLSSILSGLPLTWPLALARSLWTPLPFFAWSLPPIALILPISIVRRWRSYFALANAVDVSSRAVRWRRLLRARRLEAPLRWLTWTMVVGYSWQPLQTLGWPSSLVQAVPMMVPLPKSASSSAKSVGAAATFASANTDWPLTFFWTTIVIVCTCRAALSLIELFRAHEAKAHAEPNTHSAKTTSIANEHLSAMARAVAPSPAILTASETTSNETFSRQSDATSFIASAFIATSSTRIAARSWRLWWRKLARDFVVGVVIYGAFCALSGSDFLPNILVERLLPLAATLSALLLAVFGTEKVGAALPAKPFKVRGVWRFLVGVWLYGLFAEAALYAFVGGGYVPPRPFTFSQAPHVLLSPLVTTAALLRFQLSTAGFAWWVGPLAQAVLGLLCWWLAVALSRRQWTWYQPESSASTRLHWTRLRPWQKVAVNLQAFWQKTERAVVCFWDVRLAPLSKNWNWDLVHPWRSLYRVIENGVDLVVDWGEARANPVLDVALQRRFNTYAATVATTPRTIALRKSWSSGCAVCLVLESVLFCFVLLQCWPELTTPWLKNGVWLSNASWQSIGQISVWCLLALSWLLAMASLSALGNTFDRDRANGTLIFLFLTPLSDAEILSGKLLFPLLSLLPTLATTAPWLVFLTALAFTGGAYIFPIVALLAAVLLSCSVVLTACWQVRGAAAATKAGSGASHATWPVALLVIVTLTLLINAASRGDLVLIFMLLFLIGAHVLLTKIAWKGALSALHRQRYSDAATRGTVAN